MAVQHNSLGAVVLGGTALPTQNLQYSPNTSGQKLRHDDREFSSIQTTLGSAPSITFQTNLKNALDVIGLRIQKFVAWDFYLAKFTDGIHDANADKYSQAVGAEAYAIVNGFSAAQGGIVFANVTVFFLSSDGDTDPLVKGSSAIPAITEPLIHTLGEVTINNVATDGVQSVEASLNQRWNPTFADGKLYSQIGTYDGGEPIFSVNHADPVEILGTDFVGVEINDLTKIVLNAVDAVLQVPTVTGAITFTVGDGRIMPRQVQASIGSIATIGYDIIGLSNAAQVHPWVIS